MFRSNGLGNADQILIDDGVENMSTQMDSSDGTTGKEGKDEDEDLIQVEQICLSSVGEGVDSRPYLTVSVSISVGGKSLSVGIAGTLFLGHARRVRGSESNKIRPQKNGAGIALHSIPENIDQNTWPSTHTSRDPVNNAR